MISPVFRQCFRSCVLAGLVFAGLPTARASADVCVIIDEARDNFSPHDRAAALVLLARQFELAGQRVVPPGCPTPYVVSHVQFGTTITITLSGPKGQRDATALGMDDVPAVYSQMVRSLLTGQPMQAPGIVDRTNVSGTQSAPAKRIYSDSLLYARLGYGVMFGDKSYGGPSVGFIGYRRELDSFGIDVSFFNLQYQSSDRTYNYYGSTGSSGTNGEWLKIEFLHFVTPLSDRSLYLGAGMGWSVANLDNDNRSWSGSGLQGELSAGYELGRASTIRVFIQTDVGLPFYKQRSDSYVYSPTPPYATPTATEHRYVPSLTVSLGVGWQRGGK